LLAFDGGEALALCHETLLVPSFNYGQVEAAHLIVGHILAQHLRQLLEARRTP
jgi:hypothetical protein